MKLAMYQPDDSSNFRRIFRDSAGRIIHSLGLGARIDSVQSPDPAGRLKLCQLIGQVGSAYRRIECASMFQQAPSVLSKAADIIRVQWFSRLSVILQAYVFQRRAVLFLGCCIGFIFDICGRNGADCYRFKPVLHARSAVQLQPPAGAKSKWAS